MTRDVSDVTHRKRGLRFEKSQLVEFLPGKKKVDFRGSSWPDESVCYGHSAFVGLRADDVKAVSIEGLCVSLSPYVEKPFNSKVIKIFVPFNSKVIKIFVPELRSRECFSCFGIPMLWTFYVHFTYSYLEMLHIHILAVSWTWTVMLHIYLSIYLSM